MKLYTLVADGACSKNPGPGGYGTIIVNPFDQVVEFGGGEEKTTNNRMELMGFYRGLQEIYKDWKKNQKHFSGEERKKIRSILDSTYVVEGSKSYVWNWARNGWKTQTGEVKNKDLWEKIHKGISLLKENDFEMEYVLVKGHSGHEANERVDQISVQFSRHFGDESEPEPDLYAGPIENYSVKFEETSSFKPVYLSYCNGQLLRHATWAECEAFVKGKQGVKYKKVTNRLQEEETLKLWGVKC